MTRTFITFFLVLGICQTNFLLANTNDVMDMYLKYRLPPGVVTPTAYQLHITPDLVKLKFKGEVVIRLIALITSNKLLLNSKFLEIYDVEFMDLNTTKPLENYCETIDEQEILNITIKPQFEKDHHYSLRIKYNGILRNDVNGFYRSTVVKTGGAIGYIATTFFQPTYARLTFPCWDEPIYKAKFNITLTHDKALQAVSNTDVLKTEEKDGMITTSFKETPPMSTYLVAFVLNDHKFMDNKVGNFTYRVWAQENKLSQTDYALKMGRKIIEQMNLYTNISYQTYMPDKIDQVLVKDFSSHSTENWGLVIYRESRLLYDEALFPTQKKKEVLSAIGHEFTHQWFGNLVSPKSWKYNWLKEGLALYLQYFINHKIEPELRFDDMFVAERMQERALIDDAIPERNALNNEEMLPEDVYNFFSTITYNKGACIMRMLSHAMTEEVFHKSLKLYLTSHALGNADSKDFFGSLQTALDESGIRWKRPLQVIMRTWVEEPGYPVLTVKRVIGGYRLKQERFVSAVIKIGIFGIMYSTKWWIPITYVEESNPNFTNTTAVDWLSPKQKSYIVSSEATTGWFIFNTQQTGFYRVNYDKKNWKLLMRELNKGKYTKIHVLNRAQIIDDAFNLAHAGNLHYSTALNLSLYLTHESDYVPWKTAFRHLVSLRNRLSNSNKYYIFQRYMVYLMKALTNDVGYEPKASDTDLVKIFRVEVMKWACEFGVGSCTSYAEKIHQQWLKNPFMKLDVNLKNEILCAAVRNANESVWTDTLKYIIAFTPDKEDRKALLTSLACSTSAEILVNYLNSTIDPEYPIDLKTAAIHVVFRHPESLLLVIDFLLYTYDRIQKMPNYEQEILSMIEPMSEAVTNVEQLEHLRELLKKVGENNYTYATLTARLYVIWVELYEPIVDEWLDANSHLFEYTKNVTIKERIRHFSTVVAAFFLLVACLCIVMYE